MNVEDLLKKQREFFASDKTKDISFRIEMLERLEEEINNRMADLKKALMDDLNKSGPESYMCEIGLTLAELRHMKKHIKSYSKSRRFPTPLAQYISKSFTVQEPYGIVLIMSPWNYPVLLTLEPLIGAIAAGNCCVVKPSAYSPATSRVMKEIIDACFDDEYVACVEGGREENKELLDQKFDYIFFTGGKNVGKLVMTKAAEHLTPVTLELGGKSPCIIEKSADLKLAAKRLAWGKFLNLGQTCVAPDYVLCEASVKYEFITCLQKIIKKMYGENPLDNPDYGKIINEKHFKRILGLIDPKKVVFGGYYDEEHLKIVPTILDNVTSDDAIMKEEIFGPLLPIITVDSMDEAYDFVRKRPEPLALYLFTKDKEVENRFLTGCKFGGGCINDTIIHLATSNMGFGGIGASGMGSYHGKKSFETFSHEKSIVKKSYVIDLPMRYQPFSEFKSLLVKMFVR